MSGRDGQSEDGCSRRRDRPRIFGGEGFWEIGQLLGNRSVVGAGLELGMNLF